MDSFSAALELMPKKYVPDLKAHSGRVPEEIRLRVGQAPSVYYGGRERLFSREKVAEEDLVRILEKATGASLYSAAESMRRGFFCTGMLRIGICGKVSAGSAGRGFESYSSLCVRLAHECRGICRSAADRLCENGFENTLILSAPGGGKTTALRDLIRIFSDEGKRVGVVDERGELSREYFDLGRCSDVISGLDKLSGALLLLRSMTPQIIAADEISAPEDLAAMEEIFGCGIGILATAHALDCGDLTRRASYGSLIEKGVFRQALLIRQENGERIYELRKLA